MGGDEVCGDELDQVACSFVSLSLSLPLSFIWCFVDPDMIM